MFSHTDKDSSVIAIAETDLIEADELRLLDLLVHLVKRARRTDEPASALAVETMRQIHQMELA